MNNLAKTLPGAGYIVNWFLNS